MAYIIKNAKVVNEGAILDADIQIKNDRIHRIGNDISEKNAEYIDAKGQFLLPGVIDDQVHFREPGLTHKASIASESKAALAGGITTFIEQPNTIPLTTSIERLEEKFRIAKKTSFANYSFMLGGTNNNLEEIKKLSPLSCAGIKIFLGSSTGNMLINDEKAIGSIFSSTNLVISSHCEDEMRIRNNLEFYKSKFGNNIPMRYHYKIRDTEACFLSSSRAIKIAKKTGARLHIFHVSTGKEINLFDNTTPLKQKKITAEACVHHLWFSKKDYTTKGSLIKWNPSIKTKKDRKALRKAILEDKIDIIASDHAPHTLAEKSNSYLNCPSGGPLVQHALLVMLELFLKGKITITKVVEKMCHNPSILFQIKDRGFIREGYFADLVLVDLQDSQKVSKGNLLYKCGWSPFEGEVFQSKVTHTFVNGKLMFSKGKVSSDIFSKRLEFNRG
ncbi:dihydroorotase [Elysia marginata]|uniref:Dihydroorotase n=1 Tax=Elysia marginata TaxID=1093978 RepID=A0AAV4JBG6_9GAST|nr:dihydroorotase [Elysia marginata]